LAAEINEDEEELNAKKRLRRVKEAKKEED
jgi:hypothetical protein